MYLLMQPEAIFLNIAIFLSPYFQSVYSREHQTPKDCKSDECKVEENNDIEGSHSSHCQKRAFQLNPLLGIDCTHIKELLPKASNGVYMIQPVRTSKPFKVFCDMKDGGWTIFQIRNGLDSLNFQKGWAEYKKGFGHPSCEHWLGLENIHLLTNQANKKFKLRVELKDFEDNSAHAEYSEFWIDSETEFYRLHLGNYSGNAGDAFRGPGPPEDDQNGHMFSTYDQDNDDCKPCIFGDTAIESCSAMFGSGWWFSQCGMADLNGDWHSKDNNIGWLSGVHWKTWKEVPYSFKVSQLEVQSV